MILQDSIEREKKGIDYIKENCAMLNSKIINDLFINMVPEVFR